MEKNDHASHLFIACTLWSKNDQFQKINWWFVQTVEAIVVRTRTGLTALLSVLDFKSHLNHVVGMMLAHWWDAEHWQGDCVYFFTFLLLTSLLLFSIFFLFPGLLPLGHVLDFLFTNVPKSLLSFYFGRNVLKKDKLLPSFFLSPSFFLLSQVSLLQALVKLRCNLASWK